VEGTVVGNQFRVCGAIDDSRGGAALGEGHAGTQVPGQGVAMHGPVCGWAGRFPMSHDHDQYGNPTDRQEPKHAEPTRRWDESRESTRPAEENGRNTEEGREPFEYCASA
jgi:hypothetical protein